MRRPGGNACPGVTRARDDCGRVSRCGGRACALAAGCVQEMADQPRYDPLEPRASDNTGGTIEMPRAPVAGTVARGQLQADAGYVEGRAGGEFVVDVPERVLEKWPGEQLAQRGRERFNIFCSHCHGRVGGGAGGDERYLQLVGTVVRAGYPTPPTYHQPRLRAAPLGHFVNVIAKGLGRMPPHDYLVPPDDRWAIAAYIRALQVSQYAPTSQLEQPDMARLSDATETSGSNDSPSVDATGSP